MDSYHVAGTGGCLGVGSGLALGKGVVGPLKWFPPGPWTVSFLWTCRGRITWMILPPPYPTSYRRWPTWCARSSTLCTHTITGFSLRTDPAADGRFLFSHFLYTVQIAIPSLRISLFFWAILFSIQRLYSWGLSSTLGRQLRSFSVVPVLTYVICKLGNQELKFTKYLLGSRSWPTKFRVQNEVL